jgi:hypothetical protein
LPLGDQRGEKRFFDSSKGDRVIDRKSTTKMPPISPSDSVSDSTKALPSGDQPGSPDANAPGNLALNSSNRRNEQGLLLLARHLSHEGDLLSVWDQTGTITSIGG